MNYKSICSRKKGNPLIHAEGEPEIHKTPSGIEYGRTRKTLCGFKIINGIYTKWHSTEEEPTCIRCLGKVEIDK